MFVHVSLWGVLLAAAAGMIVGMIWYSPSVFGKAWMKAIGQTEKGMNERMGQAMPQLIIVSLLTAYALSLVATYLHDLTLGSGFTAAVDASLLVGIGFGATTVIAHSVFDPRERQVMGINVGNRIVTLLAMGVVIGLFMR
jgi:hypothetical protein